MSGTWAIKLLDLELLQRLPANQVQQMIGAEMLRTFREAGAAESPAGRAEWFAGWRAVLEDVGARGLAPQASVTIGLEFLRLVEKHWGGLGRARFT